MPISSYTTKEMNQTVDLQSKEMAAHEYLESLIGAELLKMSSSCKGKLRMGGTGNILFFCRLHCAKKVERNKI